MSIRRRIARKYTPKKMKRLGVRVKGGPSNVQLVGRVKKVKAPKGKILTPKKKQRSFGFGWR